MTAKLSRVDLKNHRFQRGTVLNGNSLSNPGQRSPPPGVLLPLNEPSQPLQTIPDPEHSLCTETLVSPTCYFLMYDTDDN